MIIDFTPLFEQMQEVYNMQLEVQTVMNENQLAMTNVEKLLEDILFAMMSLNTLLAFIVALLVVLILAVVWGNS